MNKLSVVLERALGVALSYFVGAAAIGAAINGKWGYSVFFAFVTWAMLCVINWREGK